jgi:hypothetical protein
MIKCVAEKIDTRTRYDIKATITRSAADGWDPLRNHNILVE